MAKKKYDPNDFTNQEQAMNQEDVNGQDARTRLWQSLNYSYGKQRDESDRSFDRNISQQDNAALARGMGRSSYAEQIRAGLLNDKTQAQNDIYAAQIADYQNRIGQIEQQEKEDERWERQYADQRADTEWSQNMQTQQFDWQRGQAEQQMAYQKERDAIADAFNERQWQAQQDQWKQEFDYNAKTNEQKIAFDIVTAALAAGNDADDATLARAGISRAEYNSMKKKAASGGRGGRKGGGDEDALAKSLGFTGANDPRYIAYKNINSQISDKDVEVEGDDKGFYSEGFKNAISTISLNPNTIAIMNEINKKKNNNGG